MKRHQNVLIVNVQILCSYGQIQCGELPFVNRSLDNKLVQNYMETKHLNENNQAEYIDNTYAWRQNATVYVQLIKSDFTILNEGSTQ